MRNGTCFIRSYEGKSNQSTSRMHKRSLCIKIWSLLTYFLVFKFHIYFLVKNNETHLKLFLVWKENGKALFVGFLGKKYSWCLIWFYWCNYLGTCHLIFFPQLSFIFSSNKKKNVYSFKWDLLDSGEQPQPPNLLKDRTQSSERCSQKYIIFFRNSLLFLGLVLSAVVLEFSMWHLSHGPGGHEHCIWSMAVTSLTLTVSSVSKSPAPGGVSDEQPLGFPYDGFHRICYIPGAV